MQVERHGCIVTFLRNEIERRLMKFNVEKKKIEKTIKYDCSSKESKYSAFPQVSTVSICIKRDSVRKVWSQVMSSGMTKTPLFPVWMIKVEPFLTASMERTHWFDFVVQQEETKMSLSSSPLNLRFSCWPMPQKNARWWSGRWLAWSGFIITQNTGVTMTKEKGRILTTLENNTRLFTTVTITVKTNLSGYCPLCRFCLVVNELWRFCCIR